MSCKHGTLPRQLRICQSCKEKWCTFCNPLGSQCPVCRTSGIFVHQFVNDQNLKKMRASGTVAGSGNGDTGAAAFALGIGLVVGAFGIAFKVISWILSKIFASQAGRLRMNVASIFFFPITLCYLPWFGVRAKNKAWLVWGVVYLSPLVTSIALSLIKYPHKSTLVAVAYLMTTCGWIAAFIHSNVAYREYLLKVKGPANSSPNPNDKEVVDEGTSYKAREQNASREDDLAYAQLCALIFVPLINGDNSRTLGGKEMVAFVSKMLGFLERPYDRDEMCNAFVRVSAALKQGHYDKDSLAIGFAKLDPDFRGSLIRAAILFAELDRNTSEAEKNLIFHLIDIANLSEKEAAQLRKDVLKYYKKADRKDSKKSEGASMTNSVWDSEDPFLILSVSQNATEDEIRKSYHRLMLQYHPDKVAGLAAEFKDIAEARSKTLNWAYDECLKRKAA